MKKLINFRLNEKDVERLRLASEKTSLPKTAIIRIGLLAQLKKIESEN